MDKENIEAPPHYLSLPHRFHDLENQLKSSLARQTKYVKALNYDETNETTGGWLILQFISSPYTWSFYFLTRLCFSHFFVFVVVMGVMIRFREKVLGALKKIAHAKNLLLHKVFSMPYQETKKVDYVKAARTLEQLRFLKKLLQDIQPLVLPRSEIVGKLDLTSHTDFASHIKIDSLPMPTPKKSV